MANRVAERWRLVSIVTLNTAKHLREHADFRSCVSRAYYATYQAATSACVAHGDAVNFPPGWNNPSHEQLPGLIVNNGALQSGKRLQIAKVLRQLRTFREDADYRPGITVDEMRSREAVLLAVTVFELLEIDDD